MTDRRLTKSRDDRMIAGVCGGLAEYFSIDAVLVRVAFVLLGVFGGGGVIAYIVLMLIMPEPAVGSGSGVGTGEASPPPESPTGGESEPPPG